MNTVENPYRNVLGGERIRELCSFCKFSRYPQVLTFSDNKQCQFSKLSLPPLNPGEQRIDKCKRKDGWNASKITFVSSVFSGLIIKEQERET
jgi:hypothetical protein